MNKKEFTTPVGETYFYVKEDKDNDMDAYSIHFYKTIESKEPFYTSKKATFDSYKQRLNDIKSGIVHPNKGGVSNGLPVSLSKAKWVTKDGKWFGPKVISDVDVFYVLMSVNYFQKRRDGSPKHEKVEEIIKNVESKSYDFTQILNIRSINELNIIKNTLEESIKDLRSKYKTVIDRENEILSILAENVITHELVLTQ